MKTPSVIQIFCPICKSKSFKPLYTIPRGPIFIYIVHCVCGHIYQNPQLAKKEVAAYYKNYTRETYRSLPTPEKERSIAIIQHARFKNIEQFVRPGKILDIGCAFGSFLSAAKERGWDVSGVELVPSLAEFAKKCGIRVYTKPIEDVPMKPESFDVITMFDVLEHIPDPRATLERCHTLLKKGGLLVIQTPSVDSLYALIRGKKWEYFGVDHLNYFSDNILKRLFKEIGFHIVKTFTGDDIGLINNLRSYHAKVGEKKTIQSLVHTVGFHTLRRLNIYKSFGSRVYYARKC